MSQRIGLFCSLFLCGVTCHAAAWRQVAPAKSGFHVQMPGKPTEQKEVEETEYGKTTTRMLILAEELFTLVSGYSELSGIEAVAPTKTQFAGFRSGLLEGKSRVLGEREIKLQGHAGRALSFQDEDGLIYRSRYFVANNHIYFVLAGAYKDDVSKVAPTIEKFFNSLQLLSLPPAPTPKWNTFSAIKGRFSVLFPGAPKQNKVVKFPRQPPVYSFVAYDQNAAYIVTYIDFLVGQIPEDPEQALTFYQAGFLKGVKGSTLKSLKNINLNQWPGRELQFLDANGMNHQARIYAVKNRMYAIDAAVSSEKKEIASEGIKKFFESFKATEGEAPQKLQTPQDS